MEIEIEKTVSRISETSAQPATDQRLAPSTAVGGFEICQAESVSQIAFARELFLEYAQSLGFSLCFQGFNRELAGLPGDYAPPKGRLLLLMVANDVAGCVALHKIDGSICEMKRLYVRPAARGTGTGRALAEAVVDGARAAGYGRMRLDTIDGKMDAAIALYRGLGFREIPAYTDNPIDGARYLELALGG